MRKQDIRRIIKTKREELNKDLKTQLDQSIMNRFIESEYFEKSNIIFIYVNMDSEINTIEIIKESLKRGKRVAVPKVLPVEKEMVALEIKSLLDLNESGSYGILEPGLDKKEVSEQVDLVVLPGLAFEENGYRIGYGGGFYDKFLNKHKNIDKVALCYNFQIISDMPKEDYDQRVDAIMTESKTITVDAIKS